MQMDKAIELQKAWVDQGDPPCAHPNLDREYYLGAHTGDSVCTTCGKSGFGSDWPQREKSQNSQ